MSNFSVTAVEPLDYDFTDFPSNVHKGKNCTGKGSLPEPTEALLNSYGEKVQALFEVKDTDDPKKAVEDAMDDKAATKAENERKAQELLELTAELCQNSPNAEELKELPPRIRNAFMKWVYKELADPEVSSGATPH
ncbi:MAG: hypothetical protein AVDCRST_MAG93-5391 [uncultured Chloroflexia bacterium]|uniref:Uncharacterized protein n=1 Tax=uncultured Chloroflexia bacterium TaxID=1672391 RepID=A0A6J4KTL2_9CHLR|nr:MAG: hypothetical protein AVDCRST_MAG93-5391 [uncultured Chloroflexia bacterium]